MYALYRDGRIRGLELTFHWHFGSLPGGAIKAMEEAGAEIDALGATTCWYRPHCCVCTYAQSSVKRDLISAVYFRVSLRSPVLWVTPRDLATQKLRVWFHLVLPSTVLIAVWVTAFLAGEKKSSLVQPSPHSSFVAFPLM